jgi:hypothetical protein
MSGRAGEMRERAERGTEHAEERFGEAVGKPREEWRPRDVWAFRYTILLVCFDAIVNLWSTRHGVHSFGSASQS